MEIARIVRIFIVGLWMWLWRTLGMVSFNSGKEEWFWVVLEL